MLRKITDDFYNYLKARWWGWLVIGVLVLGAVLLGIWNALPQSQKERLLGSARPGILDNAPRPNELKKQFSDEELLYRNITAYTCRGTSEPRNRTDLFSFGPVLYVELFAPHLFRRHVGYGSNGGSGCG